MKKVISIILMMVLILGSFTMAYGFENYKYMYEEIEDIDQTQILEYQNLSQDLINQFNSLNVSYDVVSGKIVSYEPFIVYIDYNKGVIGGIGPFSGFQIPTKYAQITSPDYSAIKDGYYEAAHPYTSTIFSNTLLEKIRIYGSTNDNIKKAYELEKSIKSFASTYNNEKYNQKGFVRIPSVDGHGMYIGQIDEFGLYDGKGGIDTSISGWLDEGMYSHGKRNGYFISRSDNKYGGIYYQDTLIQEESLYVPKYDFIRLFVGTPAVEFVEKIDGKIAYNNYTNLNKGMPMEMNGTIYLPVREVIEQFDHTISWSAETGTIINNNIPLVNGSTSTTVNGIGVDFSYPIAVIDGVTYAPLTFFGNVLTIEIFVDWVDENFITPVVTLIKIV